jgi:hypothetical protein
MIRDRSNVILLCVSNGDNFLDIKGNSLEAGQKPYASLTPT